MKKAVALFLVLCLAATGFGCGASSKAYAAAQALLDSGDYIGAEAAFRQLGDYKDAPDKAKECRYRIALSLMESGEYAAAQVDFSGLGEYKDAPSQAMECRYLYAVQLMEQDAWEEASAVFEELGDHKDSAEKKAECERAQKYQQACLLLAEGKEVSGTEELYAAISLFRELGEYEDSRALYEECCFLAGERIAGAESVSLDDCLTAAGLFAESGGYAAEAPDRERCLRRLALWTYVNESGIEDTDAEGNACKKLVLRDKNTVGSSEIVTEERLTVYACGEHVLVLQREVLYSSGDTSYAESLSLRFDMTVPGTVAVIASSYQDLGIYSAYIKENCQGTAKIDSLKSRADIAMTGYVQQARLVSGANTQTYDYSDQKLIEKILQSVPEFYAEFDAEFSGLPFPLSMNAMGFGITDAPPVAADYVPSQKPAADATGITLDLYVPDDGEKFKSEQSVLVISPSGAAVHKGPANTYDIVETVAFGETLQVSAVSGGWLYVRYNKREYGWIDMTQLFGAWMFETDINPALNGITAPKKYASVPTIIATTDKANARNKPDTKSDLLGSYITGTQGVLIGTSDMWYLVNFDGAYGWVHKNNFK